MEPAIHPAGASSTTSNAPPQPDSKPNGAPPEGASPLTLLALSRIHESATNPRKTFDPQKLQELADTMRPPGRMLMPLIVRSSKVENGKYELIDGARRFRAAAIAKLTVVPVFIQQMTDAEVQLAQLISQAQHEDWPALEEAAGIMATMKATALSVDQIAAKVGKSRGTIFARLKLLDGIPDVQEALTAGRISSEHALHIARYQPKIQVKALEACFDYEKNLRSVRALDQWLDSNVRCNLEQAPFKLEDAKLDPAAGACPDCEKREGKRCLDPDCFKGKIAAHVDAQRKKLLATKKEFVEISEDYGRAPKGAIDRKRWQAVPAGQTGPGIQRALMRDGLHAGTEMLVKVKPAPPQARPEPKRDWEAERLQAEAKRDGEKYVRRSIFDAARVKIKAPLDRGPLEFIVENFLADDRSRRREKVDLQSLKPQALAHLLLELSVGNELEGWGKPARLVALAKACKVNADKISAQAEREWKQKQAVQTPAQAKDKTAPPKTAVAGGSR